MLTLENIDVSYGHVRALRGVSLTVPEGSMVALFGANGAGKTTTLRAVSGLVALHSGAIVFDGTSLYRQSPEQIARLGIAHIPEGRGIFPRMSVWQNLKMGGYLGKLNARVLAGRIDWVVDLFPILRDRIQQEAGTMSGGEQQMLAIARALIAKPRLLLLDEPSHGLAPKVVKDVFRTLAALRDDGVTTLVVEQYASVALAHANDAVVLDRGRISFTGTAAELSENREALTGAYLGASR